MLSDSPVMSGPEEITATSDGMHQSAPTALLKLAAERRDVYFDNVLIEAVVSPDRGEQLALLTTRSRCAAR